MDDRYIVERLPDDDALRCDICGDPIIGKSELAEARTSSSSTDVIEGNIRQHLESEHSEMFEGDFEILIEPHESELGTPGRFPDETVPKRGGVEKAAPPRSPDEKES